MSMENIFALALGVLFVLAVFVILGFIVAFPLMLAWNCAMPHIFKLPEISIMQALALYVVGLILYLPLRSGK